MFRVIDNPMWESADMAKQPFTVEALREVLSYDQETGALYWIKPSSPRLHVGDRAGSVGTNGRREINVLGHRCFAHHLAWFLHHGEWPTDYVRHKNGNFDDCRIENLYRQTPEEAGLTKALPSSNTSGFRGVSFDKRRGKWQATIRRKYKQQHLGVFDTREEAHAAFIEADAAFRPDVPPADMEAKAQEMAVRRRQRALWGITLREAGGLTGWPDEAAFMAEIGTPPGSRYSLAPTDGQRMIGPGNWAWVLPRHEEFDMTTAEGRSAYARHRREVNPAASRGADLRKSFGIGLAEYQVMHDTQEGKCVICGEAETMERGGKVRWLAVDHDHATGTVRDLLCSGCNAALGQMQDSPARLRAAATYLERHADAVAEEDAA